MKPFSVIIIGAGNRGLRYAEQMALHPDKYTVVAVADPSPANREALVRMFPNEVAQYENWQEILDAGKLADLAVISTVDNMHHAPALKAIDLGYNLLLEKPVAQTAQECADIDLAARKKGVKVLVCHVLRYAPFFVKVKELIMAGTIGKVVSIDQVEAVGNVHYSHSYVRGNWHKESDSTPMLLAKCCHDLDIIQWLLDAPCKQVSSFGSLTHFTPENAPEGAPVRCSDGNCPVGDTCPYNCIRHYYDNKTNRRRAIITTGIAEAFPPTDEDVMKALKTTEYGLCVYHGNNDVVDHQVVSMEFEGGATAQLTMNAFNKGGRYIRVYGTQGELYAHAKDPQIEIFTFEGNKRWTVDVPEVDESIGGGHGGGDQGIVRELYEYMSGDYTGFQAADITVSVRNHMIGFAAEEARHGKTVVQVDKFMEKYGL